MGVDKWNNTYYPTGSDTAALHKEWYVIDAEGQTLGRLANLAAMYLRGKNLVTYTPSMDMGAYVIIINCDKVAVTGKKETDKLYYRHTVGRPGSLKIEALRDLRVVRVWGRRGLRALLGAGEGVVGCWGLGSSCRWGSGRRRWSRRRGGQRRRREAEGEQAGRQRRSRRAP